LEIDRYALALTQKLQNGITVSYERYDFHSVVQQLQHFCSEDLGSFYLDILKDRLYTAGEDSKARRSAQNALYHITQSLARLIAPILSFTGEEVWTVLNGKEDVSIFEQQWYELPKHQEEDLFDHHWWNIRGTRDIANQEIEKKRAEGLLGSSLQAELDIYASGAIYESLSQLGDGLKLICITSRATLHRAEEGSFRIEVTPSTYEKCDRCWHYREDVGSDALHPTICGRCVSNLFGDGEVRKYA